MTGVCWWCVGPGEPERRGAVQFGGAQGDADPGPRHWARDHGRRAENLRGCESPHRVG